MIPLLPIGLALAAITGIYAATPSSDSTQASAESTDSAAAEQSQAAQDSEGASQARSAAPNEALYRFIV